MAEADSSNPLNNPYAAPAAMSRPDASFGGSSEESRLRAFVGNRADFYLYKWMPALEGRGNYCGFNLAAFVFTLMWLAYRKMYLLAVIVGGLFVIEAYAEELVFTMILGLDETPAVFDLSVSLVTATLFGLFGNRTYLWQARRKLEEVQSYGISEAEAKQALSRKGGTSFVAAIASMFLFLATVIAVVIVWELVVIGPEAF